MVDVNVASRIFVDVASKLLILSKARRVGKGFYSVSELERLSEEKAKEGLCVMLRPKDVGGYVLACDGKVIAIAIMNPPSMGSKALENVDDNPMKGDLYVIEKNVVEEALRKLRAAEEVEGLGEAAGKALKQVKMHLESMQMKKAVEELEKEVEEIDIPAIAKEVSKLEIYDMIDAVTLSDELAYYLGKRGYVVASEPPEAINNTYAVTLRVDGDVELSKLIEDIIEEAKRTQCENIIKIYLSDVGKAIFVDPIVFDKLMSIIKNVSHLGGYCYIEPKDDHAELHIVLREDLPARTLALIRAATRKMLQARQLPWKKMIIVIETPTSTFREVG